MVFGLYFLCVVVPLYAKFCNWFQIWELWLPWDKILDTSHSVLLISSNVENSCAYINPLPGVFYNGAATGYTVFGFY